MDYEKKYKDALAHAREIHRNEEEKRKDMEFLFPELKEIEDEEIRKEIINYFECQSRDEPTRKDIHNKWIAWLKKQGNPDINPSEFDLRLNKLLKQFETLPKEELASSLGFYLNVVQNDGTYKQKLSGKVEPKFKVGNWIIRSAEGFKHNTYLIKEIKDYYVCEDLKGRRSTFTFNDVHKNFKLWDISDAKDGDVLAEDSCIFIIEKMYPNGTTIVHCCLFDDGEFDSMGSTLSFDVDNTYPATKEQCELLFQKMKETGYEWDAEKKELKKISNVFEECKIVHIEHGKYYYCIKDYFYGGKKQASKGDVIQALRGLPIMGLKDASEYFLPVNSIKCNSAWGEDDESILQGIWDEILANKHHAKEYEWKTYDKFLNWLKSIKDRYTWKQNDRQIEELKDAIDAEIVEVEDNDCSICGHTHLEICTDEDLSKICKPGDKAKVIIIKQK